MLKKFSLISLSVLAVVMFLSLVSCGDDDGPTGSVGNDAALIGTWNLSTVNGVAPVSGVFLRWVFTATTVTGSSDLDCVTVTEYTTSGGKITAVSLVSIEGTQCGDDDDQEIGESFPYSIEGNTFTITFTDPDLDPSVAVFVFTKES